MRIYDEFHVAEPESKSFYIVHIARRYSIKAVKYQSLAFFRNTYAIIFYRYAEMISLSPGASKEQVMKMLQQILHFTEDPKHYDATDALAVAVCHYFQQRTALPGAGEKINGWKDFLAKNPGKIKLPK